MVVFIFSVFDWKYPSWGNLVQKIKIVNLSWNVADQFKYAKFNGGIHFLYFKPEIPFLGK